MRGFRWSNVLRDVPYLTLFSVPLRLDSEVQGARRAHVSGRVTQVPCRRSAIRLFMRFVRFSAILCRYTRIRSLDADPRGGICRSAGQQYAVRCNARGGDRRPRQKALGATVSARSAPAARRVLRAA